MRLRKKIPVFILCAIIVICGFMIIGEQLGMKKEADDFTELAEIVMPDNTEEAETLPSGTSEESAEKKTNYDELYAINHDFIGWIRIDGTTINYPVMQSKADPEYYLRRNFYKQYSQSGVPFADARCDIGISDNVIVYGHNMKNGTMFSNMRHYKNKSYWQQHPVIHFDTLTASGEYEVMAILITSTEKKSDQYSVFNFINASDENNFNEFISTIKKQSLYDTGITAEYGDKLITLSTCNKSGSSERLIIVARKFIPKFTELLSFEVEPILCGGSFLRTFFADN